MQTGLDGFSTNTLQELNTPISLPPGTYWLVFYPQMDVQAYGQYGRYLSDTTNGHPAKLINPGGELGWPTTCTSAQDTLEITQQDFAFSLKGRVDTEFLWELFYPAFIKRKWIKGDL